MIWWTSLALASPGLQPEQERALLQGMSWMHVDTLDLAFDAEEINVQERRDLWRLPQSDRLLRAPLDVPGDAARLAEAVQAAGGELSGQLSWSLEELGWSASPVPAAHPSRLAWRDRRRLDPRLVEVIEPAFARIQQLRAAVAGAYPQELQAILDWQLRPTHGRVPTHVEQLTALQGLWLAESSDRAVMAGAAVEGSSLAAALESQLSALPAGAWPEEPVVLDGLVIGSPGADRLSSPGEAMLVIDPGGDDVWEVGLDPRFSLILDLAGDDEHHGGCGGVGGVGICVDAAGNDRWSGGQGSLGGAFHGVGLLLDRSGDDLYQGESRSQGSGEHGVGLLIDLEGEDRYRVGAQGQGHAGVQGVGLLYDASGRDVYNAGGGHADYRGGLSSSVSLSQGMAIGQRPLAGGGLGLLVEGGGDDGYVADRYAQGAGYWYGRGYLVDLGGNDSYRAQQYGQGAGIHYAIGGLFDSDGDDVYRHGRLGQGGAHDYAVGWLVDHQGDDLFSLAHHTGQGVALTNSKAFFVEGGGDDVYHLQEQPERARGGGNLKRGAGAFALSVDLGGQDTRSPEMPAEGEVRRPWAWGAAFDLPLAVPLPDPEPQPELPEAMVLPAAELPFADLPLAPQAMQAWLETWPQGVPSERLTDVDASSLEPMEAAELFVECLPLLRFRRSTVSTRMSALLRRARTDPAAVKRLLPPLRARLDSEPISPVLAWIGWVGDDSDLARVTPLLTHPSPRMRRGALGALVKLGGQAALWEPLTREDPRATVRALAVHHSVQDASPQALARWLVDPSALVRFNAAAGLLEHPEPQACIEAVRGSLDTGERPVLRRLQLEVLLRLGAELEPESPWEEALVGDPRRLEAPWLPGSTPAATAAPAPAVGIDRRAGRDR